MSRRDKIGQWLIYLATFLWFGFEILVYSKVKNIAWWKVSEVNTYITMIVLILLVSYIFFFQEYSYYEVIIILAISVVVCVSTVRSGRNEIMSTWLFVMVAKKIDLDKIVFISYFALLIFSATVIYLYLIGEIDETVLYRGGRLRHSLGFIHPNYLGIRCFQFITAHIYLRRNKIAIWDYILIGGAIYFVAAVSNCQTSYYALATLLVFLMLDRLFSYFIGGRELYLKVLVLLALLVNCVSVALTYIDVMKYPVLQTLDEYLSRRFSCCHKVMNFYGISLLGQQVQIYGVHFGQIYNKYFLDMAYSALIIRYGLIVYVLISSMYICSMIISRKNNNPMLVIILCLYAIYGIMENTMFSLRQNIFLIAMAQCLYVQPRGNEDKQPMRARIKIIM
jgi:hypothetical protein